MSESNALLATCVKAVLVKPGQGLAFVVAEREDGSRSGQTAPGYRWDRRQQQRRRRGTKPLASPATILTV